MKKVPFHRFSVNQYLIDKDGNEESRNMKFVSMSELKRKLISLGFPTHIIYELQKSKAVEFEHDPYTVKLTMEENVSSS